MSAGAPTTVQAASAAPDVSVAVVNWNTRDLTLACLDALAAACGRMRWDVWVVDNASSDDSVVAIGRAHPTARVIANSVNVGYGAAMNHAITQSAGRYVLVLNSDAAPHPGSIEAMVRHADANARIGVVGPMLVNSDGTFQGSFSNFPTLWSEFLSVTGLGRRIGFHGFPSHGPAESRVERPVDCVAGACMLVRRQTALDTDGFDQRYFMYSEETDWCFRIRQAGWDIRYLPDAQVTHHGGQSTWQIRERMYRALYRNKVRFFQIHRGGWSARALAVVFVAVTRVRRVLCQISRRPPNPALSVRELLEDAEALSPAGGSGR